MKTEIQKNIEKLNMVKIADRAVVEDNAYGNRVFPSGKEYSMDDRATGVNNNAIICGSPGSHKTRGFVKPNILKANGSYIVTDPKGNLYDDYHKYLEAKGYRTLRVCFTHPEISAHWDPLKYLTTSHDILKISNVLVDDGVYGLNKDPFWDETSRFLFNAVIAYILEHYSKGSKERSIHTVAKIIRKARRDSENNPKSELNEIFKKHKEKYPDSWAVKQWENVNIAPGKTFNTICAVALAKLSTMDTEELEEMMSFDEIDIKSIGLKKTAVFVEASDTDRSMDILLSLFFDQALSKLCELADEQENSQLPVPTTLIMDDFGTSVFLPDFDKCLANIRSRKISAVLILQSIAQLEAAYDRKASTIIDCCDRFCYLCGSDVSTAQYIAIKVNKPVNSILSMPLRTCWTFERGSAPDFSNAIELNDWMAENGITEEMLNPATITMEDEK